MLSQKTPSTSPSSSSSKQACAAAFQCLLNKILGIFRNAIPLRSIKGEFFIKNILSNLISIFANERINPCKQLESNDSCCPYVHFKFVLVAQNQFRSHIVGRAAFEVKFLPLRNLFCETKISNLNVDIIHVFTV